MVRIHRPLGYGPSTLHQRARKEQARACAIAGIEEQGTDVIDECVIPMYQEATSVKFPECPKSSLMRVVCKYQTLFRTMPGVTNASHHFIPTTGTRWSRNCVCQSVANNTGTTVQRHPKRVSSSGVCPQTVSSLPARTSLSIPH